MPSEAQLYTRITIRLPTTLKQKIEQAAAQCGMTVTHFINSSLMRAVHRTAERVRRRELSERDQGALMEMLGHPKGPNKALLRAATRYRARYGA